MSAPDVKMKKNIYQAFINIFKTAQSLILGSKIVTLFFASGTERERGRKCYFLKENLFEQIGKLYKLVNRLIWIA